MGAVQEEIRRRLEALEVSETTSFPLFRRVIVSAEMADLRIYDGKIFKGHLDKVRQEYVVWRRK